MTRAEAETNLFTEINLQVLLLSVKTRFLVLIKGLTDPIHYPMNIERNIQAFFSSSFHNKYILLVI